MIGILTDTELSLSQLARKYSGTPDTVSRIRNGKRYIHVAPELPRIPFSRRYKRLPQETINTILSSVEPANEIALRLGLSKTTVCAIRNGTIYKEEFRKFFTAQPKRDCSSCVFYAGHTERTRHKGKRVIHHCDLSIPEILGARATRFANECGCYMEAT